MCMPCFRAPVSQRQHHFINVGQRAQRTLVAERALSARLPSCILPLAFSRCGEASSVERGAPVSYVNGSAWRALRMFAHAASSAAPRRGRRARESATAMCLDICVSLRVKAHAGGRRAAVVMLLIFIASHIQPRPPHDDIILSRRHNYSARRTSLAQLSEAQSHSVQTHLPSFSTHT